MRERWRNHAEVWTTRGEILVGTSREKHPVAVGQYDAWLFDLDGVVTDPASVHAAAWKEMFDGYLKEISEREGGPFVPFEVDPDYYRYVDGKPRYEGVDAFLRSRGIQRGSESPGCRGVRIFGCPDRGAQGQGRAWPW